MPKTSVDPDAQAFITAAGITDVTQKSSINTSKFDVSKLFDFVILLIFNSIGTILRFKFNKFF